MLHFLNGVLKNDPAGLAYLRKQPAAPGVPAHSVRHQFFPAQKAAPAQPPGVASAAP